MRPDVSSFLITCEHGGNRIPAICRSLFRGQRKLLESHRGYDPGALVMARALGRAFAAGVVSSTVSRLVIDLNSGRAVIDGGPPGVAQSGGRVTGHFTVPKRGD